MTGTRVVDASALAALIFAEPEADSIAGRLEGATLAAPSLLEYELAEVLRAAYRMAHRLRVETVPVDDPGVVELAEATGLTAYDASYLWLARSMGAELVTLDRKLAATAA